MEMITYMGTGSSKIVPVTGRLRKSIGHFYLNLLPKSESEPPNEAITVAYSPLSRCSLEFP